jgi:hypothetical protein
VTGEGDPRAEEGLGWPHFGPTSDDDTLWREARVSEGKPKQGRATRGIACSPRRQRRHVKRLSRTFHKKRYERIARLRSPPTHKQTHTQGQLISSTQPHRPQDTTIHLIPIHTIHYHAYHPLPYLPHYLPHHNRINHAHPSLTHTTTNTRHTPNTPRIPHPDLTDHQPHHRIIPPTTKSHTPPARTAPSSSHTSGADLPPRHQPTPRRSRIQRTQLQPHR